VKNWASAGHETLAALGVVPAPPGMPQTIADPATGTPLSISCVDAGAATCPACSAHSEKAAFVAVIEDLRLLFACPSCQQLTWLSGA
jgi:hypothetical protein